MRGRLTLLVTFLLLALVPIASAQAAPPNDEHWSFQWGPRQIDAPQAWPISTGAGQKIAIVDSGVDLNHPDLRRKIVDGATFVGCPGDPNGCGDGDWRSGRGPGDPHGTHVAGIAAASTDNREGIAGVGPDAKLLAVKVLDDEGGSFREVAAGVRWSVDHGADVVNLSLGALPGVQALEITGLIDNLRRAIAYARRHGVVVVAAAGNEFAPLCDTPAFNRGALCVIATDRMEAKASYSNFGPNERLDVVSAPGGAAFLACSEDIISTWPLGDDDFCEQDQGTRNYNFIAGTSMAAPHVAGAASLLTAQGRSDEETIDVLERTARTPPADTRGTYTPAYGWGIVDADAAVRAPRGCGGRMPTIEGTSGDDEIEGTSGRDVVAARGGDDEVRGRGGDDVICGNGGDDRLYGGDGRDRLYGGAGRDRLYGGDRPDRIEGRATS